MKRFDMMQIHEAIQYARSGEQALHLHSITAGHPLFSRYSQIAHLFDQNKDRLCKTARDLGVKVIKVERSGTDRQHVDLCGKPLQKALALCQEDAQPCLIQA